MQIVIRPTDRLRGPKALDLGPVLSALLAAAKDTPLDLAQLRIVGDWVQYRQNFREPVDVRAICPTAMATARAQRAAPDGDSGISNVLEIGLDLRRANAADLREQLRQALGIRRLLALQVTVELRLFE